ncbi:MAG TPA: hypothetical protein VF119_10505, partial [Candidatus Limnocylindrales bacterium]
MTDPTRDPGPVGATAGGAADGRADDGAEDRTPGMDRDGSAAIEADADPRPRLPYGSWPSAIRVEDVVGDVVRLAEPWIDGDDAYWIEMRPSEGGRSVLVHRAPDGTTSDVTPPPFDVRSRVHEYGGGSYTVAGGIVLFSDR